MTCGALSRDYYVGAEGMRRFREQVNSCPGGELGNGIVILNDCRTWEYPFEGVL
jgi:hypothetical protein